VVWVRDKPRVRLLRRLRDDLESASVFFYRLFGLGAGCFDSCVTGLSLSGPLSP